MKYERLPREKYPIEVKHFTIMQKRVAKGYSTTAWPRTLKGFYAFLKLVGIAPIKMNKISLGRKNHKKGYQPGNCFWQEHSENMRESGNRKENKKRLIIMNKSLERREYLSKVNKKIWTEEKCLEHANTISEWHKKRSPEHIAKDRKKSVQTLNKNYPKGHSMWHESRLRGWETRRRMAKELQR